MPLLTEATHPRKRRAPVWLLVLAVVVLPLVGLFGWSWSQLIDLGPPDLGVAFGCLNEETTRAAGASGANYAWEGDLIHGFWTFRLPGKEAGWYYVGWTWRKLLSRNP
jgi:hypothetical protein